MFTVHFRLRAFESGVLVIQALSHSDEEVIRTTKQIVSKSTRYDLLRGIGGTLSFFCPKANVRATSLTVEV